MRIVCRNCATAYEVEGEQLRPGRTVRCDRCRCEWVAVEALPAVVEREPRSIAVNAFPVRTGHRIASAASPTAVGWGATAVVIVLVVWAALAGRAAIEHVWPPSVRLYTALGFTR